MINELGYKFIYDVVERNIPRSVVVKINEEDFCALTCYSDSLEIELQKIRHSIDSYLGISFCISLLDRRKIQRWRVFTTVIADCCKRENRIFLLEVMTEKSLY